MGRPKTYTFKIMNIINIARALSLKGVPNNGNSLRALKAYFKFIGREDVVKSYKFPRWPRRIKYNSKEEVQIFHNALRNIREKALYLFYASTGLRKNEVLSLRKDDINRRLRMVIPKNHEFSRTKHSWITFYNDEVEDLLNEYLGSRNDNSPKLFPISQSLFCKMWREAREITEIKLSPRDLRFWFCSEMGRLGVPDRYIDTFCGRIPQRIIARHYTDYSPKTLKEIYDRANLSPILILFLKHSNNYVKNKDGLLS